MRPHRAVWKRGSPRAPLVERAGRRPRGPAGRSLGPRPRGWSRRRCCSSHAAPADRGDAARRASRGPTHPTSATTRRWDTRSACAPAPIRGWSTAPRRDRKCGAPGQVRFEPRPHPLPVEPDDGRWRGEAYVGGSVRGPERAAGPSMFGCRPDGAAVRWETRACGAPVRAEVGEVELVGIRARAHPLRDRGSTRKTGKAGALFRARSR